MSIDDSIQVLKNTLGPDAKVDPVIASAAAVALDLLAGFLKDVRRIADAAEATVKTLGEVP